MVKLPLIPLGAELDPCQAHFQNHVFKAYTTLSLCPCLKHRLPSTVVLGFFLFLFGLQSKAMQIRKQTKPSILTSGDNISHYFLSDYVINILAKMFQITVLKCCEILGKL